MQRDGTVAMAMFGGIIGFAVMFIALLLLGGSGCAPAVCYEVVAVTPRSGEALLFDACSGNFVYRSVPQPAGENEKPQAGPVAPSASKM